MRNRAKCNLCKSVIESITEDDFVTCECKEIMISGGTTQFYCGASDWGNFLRIDDNDNEVVPVIKDAKKDVIEKGEYIPFTKDERKAMLYEELEMMLSNIENLPQHVMQTPITHADFAALMILLTAIFKDEL